MKRCPQCRTPVTGHPNKRFCNSRCKDRYHNTHNPRGYGRVPEPDPDDDPSWDAHKHD